VKQEPTFATPEQKSREPGPVVASFSRGSLPESVLRGHIAVSDSNEELVAWAGNPDLPAYFRSSAKPFQALPLIRSGAADRFGFTTQEIALACASHNAALVHQHVARSMMDKIGLGEDALQCGVSEPLDPEASARLTLGLDQSSPVQCECSGKHAGMLAVCVHEGYPIDSYLDPAHPLQQRILEHVAEALGLAADEIVIGVDGCSLPTYGAPLRCFARAYSIFAREAMPGLDRIQGAMTAHPDMIAGDGEIDTDLMRLTQGRVVAKLGAEGLLCIALPGSGTGIALKVEAGVERAHGPAIVHTLEQMDVLDASSLALLRERFIAPITNFAGKEVGRRTSPFTLDRG
jgi:L-asparaginase II